MRKNLRTITAFLALVFVFGGVFAQKVIFPSKEFTPTNKEISKSPVVKATQELVVYYEEGFEDWDSEEPSLLPEGWELFRTSALNDSPTTAPADKFWVANNPDSDPFGEGEPEIYVKTGEGSIVIGYTAPDFTWAVTPEINLPNADNLMLSYWPWYQHNADESWFSNYHVKIFADGAWVLLKSFIGGTSGEAANTFTSAVEFELDAYKGKSVKIAFIYEYTDGYQMAIDDIKIEGDEAAGEEYTVIFNVDMTGVEGFDPATDKVYLTGSFTGWTEPGEDGSIEMTRVTSKEQAVYYEEGFEDWDSEEPSLLPEGWELFRTSALNDSPTTAPADKFWVANNPDSDPFGEGEPEIYVKTGEGSIVIGYTAPDFTWAVTPEINLPNADNLMLSYWPWYQHNADESWFSNYHVKIFADGAWVLLKSFIGGTSGEAANTFTSAVEFELDAYKGKSVKIAFIYEYTDGYQMAIDDIKIEGDEAAGEDLFYTATVEIEAGEIKYKYFKNAGWSGGEWDGQPDRVVIVEGDMTINDVWGEITSAEEIKPDASSTTLYPNPATYELNVQHSSRISEIRVFDITGRMVYNTAVNNITTTKVDVSRFSNGVYILQVVAQDGITSKKFVKR